MKKTALITGATGGIGSAIARKCAEANYQLILCGRNSEKLEQLKSELENQTAVYTALFDVSSREEVARFVDSLPNEFSQIDLLVNNAGNAHGLDLSQDAALSDWELMIDTNIKGVMFLTKAILPKMLEVGSGHIINIGSTAAKEVYPRGNMYCATKSAVDTLTNGLRIDLNGTGIRVSAVHPAMVQTDFSKVRFKGDEARAAKVYEGFQPLKPEDIANIVHFIAAMPPHVNISDLVVYPTDQASATLVNRKL